MEITWNVGLETAAKDIVKRVADKKAAAAKAEESVYEKYLRERGEKKSAARREARRKAKAGELEEGEELDIGKDEHGNAADGSVFNDPFFTSAGPTKNKKKKAARLAKEEQEKKEQEAADEDKKKAELELLVMDEQDDGRGYSLNELVKDEENKGKKKKMSKRNKKRSKNVEEEEAAPDLFEMNVGDDRFAALGANADFHIDPTANQFKKTKGMKELQTSVIGKAKDRGNGSKAKQSTAPKLEKVSKVKASLKTERSDDSLINAVKRGAAEHEQKQKKKQRR